MTRTVILLLSSAVLLSAGCGADEETRQEVESAASSGAALQISQGMQAADRTACRANMTTLATTLEIYYATHGIYPEDVHDLRESGGSAFSCPSCHLDYRLETTREGRGYTLTCPEVPSHGSTVDGDPDWN